MTTAVMDVCLLLPEPSRIRRALAFNLRERRALELALKASEFVAESVKPLTQASDEEALSTTR
ncbi:MAG TPA: hypothetical protein VL175_12530 [Pirellulales bacterium]|jgi:hypothetical protein|nr:hypothetical protein [Pirellulales bacterium]